MFYFWNTGQRRLKKERKKKNRETKNKRCFCFVKFSVAQAAESIQSTNNYILSNSRLRSESGFILVIFIIFIFILSEFIVFHSKWQRIFDILWFESKWKRDSKQKNVDGRVWVKSRFAETCASGYFCFEENKVCHA